MKFKSQKHRPMVTLITRTNCSWRLHNTTPNSTVLSSLISSVPNELCFFVSLPSNACALQTTAYASSSMNFAKACLSVCVGSVMLCHASCPVQQTLWGTSINHLDVPFWRWMRSPCQSTYVIRSFKLILLWALAKKDWVIHFKNQTPLI